MPPSVTGFRNSPDEGKGRARDFRVRWALEEVGLPYAMDFVPMAETPAFRARMEKYVELVSKQPLDTSQFESQVFSESADLLTSPTLADEDEPPSVLVHNAPLS